MNQLTAEQLEQLADWYHARECRRDHNDRCGWYWENTSSYPANATRWSHDEWKQRVPALVERDRQNVDRLYAILGQRPTPTESDPTPPHGTPRPAPELCMAVHPRGFRCSLDLGHPGDHQAATRDAELAEAAGIAASWPR